MMRILHPVGSAIELVVNSIWNFFIRCWLSNGYTFTIGWVSFPLVIMAVLASASRAHAGDPASLPSDLPSIQFTGGGNSSVVTTGVGSRLRYQVSVSCPSGKRAQILRMSAQPMTEKGRCEVPRGSWVDWHQELWSQTTLDFTDDVASCLQDGEWRLAVVASCGGALEETKTLKVNILSNSSLAGFNGTTTSPTYVMDGLSTFRPRDTSGGAGADHVYQLQFTSEANMCNTMFNLAREATQRWNRMRGFSYDSPQGLYEECKRRYGSGGEDVGLNLFLTKVTNDTGGALRSVYTAGDWEWLFGTNPAVGLSRTVVMSARNTSQKVTVTTQTTVGSVIVGSIASPIEGQAVVDEMALAYHRYMAMSGMAHSQDVLKAVIPSEEPEPPSLDPNVKYDRRD